MMIGHKAVEAVNCAGEQGKYWEMHDRLFQNQQDLSIPGLRKYAEAIGLDLDAFQRCLDSGKQADKIRRDIEGGQKVGVQGTSTFFLGFQEPDSQNLKVLRMIVGAQPYTQFKETIEWALKEIREYSWRKEGNYS